MKYPPVSVVWSALATIRSRWPGRDRVFRESFVSGRFKDALVIYARLWIYSRKFSVAMVESLIHGLCI